MSSDTVERLKKMAEHVPREFDSVEDALIQKAASDGLELLNKSGVAAVSNFVRSGERLGNESLDSERKMTVTNHLKHHFQNNSDFSSYVVDAPIPIDYKGTQTRDTNQGNKP